MSKEFANTISGTYKMVPMPDGTEVMMHQLSNGKWVVTEDRANDSITERFKDTEFKPDNWKTPPPTEKRVRNIEDLIKVSKTFAGLHAFLIERLGQPEDILKNGKLFRPINDPCIRRDIETVIKIANCYPWNDVLKIMHGEH